jgi:hypothetical protein
MLFCVCLAQMTRCVFFFLKVILTCAHPHMLASPDPRNTFGVTVPPLLSQDQSFTFTFRPACPRPVVSSLSTSYNSTNELVHIRQLKSPWDHV